MRTINLVDVVLDQIRLVKVGADVELWANYHDKDDAGRDFAALVGNGVFKLTLTPTQKQQLLALINNSVIPGILAQEGI